MRTYIYGPTAINAAKTHCIRGHEFTPENTSRYGRAARRHCKTCRRLSRGSRSLTDRNEVLAMAGLDPEAHKGQPLPKVLPEYSVWADMRKRCRNAKHRSYAYYGGRGITVCARWESFADFFADMGRRPSSAHSIDRRDNNGNYEPTNCGWATHQEQMLNRRNALPR